jgi:predicted phosphodiesterase
MRIALLSDIHGNIEALDAVLEDIHTNGGVDAYWLLVDLATIGPAPVKVLEHVSQLPNTRFVRGNTDRYTCTGDRPPPTLEEVRINNDLFPQRIEMEGDFAWTQGALMATCWWNSITNPSSRPYSASGTRQRIPSPGVCVGR